MTKIPISALIFDAGDVIVHKIPDDQVDSWLKIKNLLLKYDIYRDNIFSFLYNRIRILGENNNSKFISAVTGEVMSETMPKTLDIKLFEEYEIEKWWKNPDPMLLNLFMRVKETGYKIGILTDSVLNSKRIWDILDKYSGLINAIVSSRDLGVMKPDHRMYEALLFKLNVPAKKTTFIAHDIDELEGARDLGINIENYNEIQDLNLLIQLINSKYIFLE